MTPPCTRCGNPRRIPINLSAEDLSALDNDLRFEYGPFVVPPERAERVRTMLALMDKDLEDCESEPARLDKQTIAAQAEKYRLATQRAKLCALLSPVRKLPNETLMHIFQHVCEENLLQCYPWPKHSPPTEMTSPAITYLPTMAISSVCFRWHAFVLSSPSLWANLAVETLNTSLDKEGDLVGFISTVTRYLERSGDSPLRLVLTIYDSSGSRAAKVPSLIHLTQHAHRWKTFKYHGDHSLIKYSQFSKLHCPLLEELDIAIMLNGLNCFKHYLRLCTLSTSEPVGPTPKLLYNQLDHINLYRYSLTELVVALCSCPSLKSLELGYIDGRKQKLGRWGTWRNITSLALGESTSLRMVFYSFDFPSLNKLVITGGDRWPAHGFASFISRSSCMITTFTLLGTSMYDLDLIAALQVMPALLHLEVKDHLRPKYIRKYRSPLTPLLVWSLTHDESTSISLVPRLRSLHLTWIRESTDASDDASDVALIGHAFNSALDDEPDDAFDDAAFVSMVESRWFKPGSDLSAEMLAMGRSSIQSVVLKFPNQRVDADIYKPLRILDAEGLRVVVAGTNGVQV